MRRLFTIATLTIIFAILFLPSTVHAQRSRGAVVESISNERSSFAIRVEADRQDRTYARNDLLRATVTSSEDGYLYLFYQDANGKTVVLFPNSFQKDNAIRKGEAVTVPAEGSGFRIRIDAPFGEELLKAVVSKRQLDGADIERWTRSNATPVSDKEMEQFAKSLPTDEDLQEKNRWHPNPFDRYSGRQGLQNPYGQQSGQQGQQNPYGQQPGQQGQQNPYGQQPGQQGQQNPYGQQSGQQGQQNPYGQQPGQQGQQTSPSQNGSAGWAEHQVRIQTIESRSGSPSNENTSNDSSQQPAGTLKGKRFAVGIGISNYQDNNIGNLGICHVDSEKMMDLFQKRCHVTQENSIMLNNEKATLANIRKVLKERLPQVTNPGDTVIIFWSGHGGQTDDKKKEFLIPYDGKGSDIENTMLMDETFGRWLQELDGRKILVLLDACHSGGQANSAKSLSKTLDDDADGDWQPLRFAFTQLAVMKDIGQKDAAVIASSTSSEVSYVRKEKDLSVLTYYLRQELENAKEPLTHVKWCEAVKPQVTRYVEQNFSGKKQTVVMQDEMSEPLVLNP